MTRSAQLPQIDPAAAVKEHTARRRRGAASRWQRGMVTVELAVGVLVAGVLLAILSGVIGLVVLQDRCRDVAGLVAREVARGDQRGERMARAAAPHGASVVARTNQGWVTVTVEVAQRWGKLGPVVLTGEATVPLEVGVNGP